MFNFNKIWAYPTDTSFGLGVRADDNIGLEELVRLKGGRSGKFFSLMCRDEKMLKEFAEVPDNFDTQTFFSEKPRTVILKPTNKLPKTKFWPNDKVAFRISTMLEIARNIDFPITATSANLSGEGPIFNIKNIKKVFGDRVEIYTNIPELVGTNSSEIWDFTEITPRQIR